MYTNEVTDAPQLHQKSNNCLQKSIKIQSPWHRWHCWKDAGRHWETETPILKAATHTSEL